jgi:hypothetical protein
MKNYGYIAIPERNWIILHIPLAKKIFRSLHDTILQKRTLAIKMKILEAILQKVEYFKIIYEDLQTLELS